MGQKVNPNIFQLGKKKYWLSKFLATKQTEKSKYFFKDIELNKFVLKFFENNNLLVNNCKINYTNDNLFIFVSYFFNSMGGRRLRLKKSLVKKTRLKEKKVVSKKKNLFKHFLKNVIKKKKLIFKIDKYFKNKNKKISKKAEKLRKNIRHDELQKKRYDFQLKKKFLNKFFVSTSFFFFEKAQITLNFYPLNGIKEKKTSKKEIQFIIKNLNKLRYYNNSSFLKEGLQIIIIALKYNKTVNFLTRYIVLELQKHKKQHFFLNFIKKALEIFNKKEFCTPKNIKILINGRFNGVSRSKSRIILVGNPISVISEKTKLYYYQDTSFSENGTFGVRTWISEKEKKQIRNSAKHPNKC